MHNTPHTEESKRRMSASKIGRSATWNLRPSKIENGIEVYRCGTCHDFFPHDGFYKNKRTQLGITSSCRKCHMGISIRSRNPENTRRLAREHMSRWRKANLELARARDRCRVVRHDLKSKARMVLNLAVRAGKLKRPSSCSRCGMRKPRINGHHKDYAKPLEVIWLCYVCHPEVEREERSGRYA